MLVPDAVRDCACFAYAVVKGTLTPIGTAFFIGVPIEGTDKYLGFLVTALHVVAGARAEGDDGCVYLRVNLKAGGSQVIKVEDPEWTTPDQSEPVLTDVALCQFGPSQEIFEYRFLGIDHMLTDEIAKAEAVGVGDDLFFTGLFVNHYGVERNIPVVRVGNIATMPGEPVQTRLGPMAAYLVEARSVGGLSGSPVFVHLGSMRFGSDGHPKYRPANSRMWYLLGVMHGHWRYEAATGTGADLRPEYVNMGMAIVTPISAVLQLLEAPSVQNVLNLAARKAAQQQTDGLPVMDGP